MNHGTIVDTISTIALLTTLVGRLAGKEQLLYT